MSQADVCGKGMPEGMATDVLYHPSIAGSFFDGPLKNRLVCMMSPFLAGFRGERPITIAIPSEYWDHSPRLERGNSEIGA